MKKLFILLFFICSASNICLASAISAYDAGAINSQYMRDLRTHEAAARAKKNNSAIVSTKTAPKTQEEITTSNIKTVTFVNNNEISTSELTSVIENDINKPMTAENISAIRKNIMKYYQDRGFFSAVAMVISQDTQNGELVIDVKEGGKNSITIQE